MQKIRKIKMNRERNNIMKLIITDNQVTLFLHNSTLSCKLFREMRYNSTVN